MGSMMGGWAIAQNPMLDERKISEVSENTVGDSILSEPKVNLSGGKYYTF